MGNHDQPSRLSPQVERAENEGMVDLPPPPLPSVEPEGNLDETRTAARHLLELQFVAQKAYEGTLSSMSPGPRAKAIAAVAEELKASMDTVRSQLARLHDHDKVDPSRAAKAVERVTGIAAGMFGEATSAKGLMLGELAMAQTAKALIGRKEMMPSVRAALTDATVDSAKRRAEELRAIASKAE